MTTPATTAAADRAYLAALDILGSARRPEIFRMAAEFSKERADRLISACEVLAFDACADERLTVRDRTQDLLDVTELLIRLCRAANDVGANTIDDVVAAHATEYEGAVRTWTLAMADLISASLA
jgi:hypothetical protein